jgi:hypothetical protein
LNQRAGHLAKVFASFFQKEALSYFALDFNEKLIAGLIETQIPVSSRAIQ